MKSEYPPLRIIPLLYEDGIFTCECGKEYTMAEISDLDDTNYGVCECGNKWCAVEAYRAKRAAEEREKNTPPEW